MKILLVEPDEYYHSQFTTHTSDLGELAITSNAGEARELIAKINPDVIVLELLLSDGPAYKLLEEMNEDRRKFIPTIIFSKINNPEDIEAALNLGSNGCWLTFWSQTRQICICWWANPRLFALTASLAPFPIIRYTTRKRSKNF